MGLDKPMKITSLLSAVLLLAVTGLRAEDPKPAGDPPKAPEGRPERGPGGPQMTPEERVKIMTEKLGLSEEQQTKIKAIYAKNDELFKAFRGKDRPNLNEEERRKRGEAMKAQGEEINAVLTEEQKAKLKEMRGKGRGQGRGPKDGEKGAPPPPPPAPPAAPAPK